MKRCKWCNENNPLYVDYHDNEWGVLNIDDKYLYEMLILEPIPRMQKEDVSREPYDGIWKPGT